MKDGLYKVHFEVPGNQGAGVVVLSGGIIRGGDSSIYYHGSYTTVGDQLNAEVKTDAHTKVPGGASVFGIDRVTITLTGKINGDSAALTGTAKEAPGLSFQAALSRIAD
jgi:hypothetical protein